MTTAFVEGLQKMSGVENSIKNCDKFNKNESLDDRTLFKHIKQNHRLRGLTKATNIPIGFIYKDLITCYLRK